MSTPEIDKKIRKGLGPRRENGCLQTQHDIVIPAGTLLRPIGDDEYAAPVGFGPVKIAGEFKVTAKPGAELPAGSLKRVVA